MTLFLGCLFDENFFLYKEIVTIRANTSVVMLFKNIDDNKSAWDILGR